MRYRRPPRLAGFSYVGRHRYFVTCRCGGRQKPFIDPPVVECVRAQILRTCGERRFEEIASVYMPDHLHVLVMGVSRTSAFIPFMTLLRQRSAIAYRALGHGFLWQDGYLDRVLGQDADTYKIIEYMRLNPVRAGLVASPDDYPFLFDNSFAG